MCGIFGVVSTERHIRNRRLIDNIVNSLFLFSQTRGSEAAGIALNTSHSINILKQAGSPSELIKRIEYKDIFNDSVSSYLEKQDLSSKTCFSLIGHSRLVTNGSQSQDINNQPVSVPGITAVHNGIITNQNEILSNNIDIELDTEVDTELLLKLLSKHNKFTNNIQLATKKTFEVIKGSASVAAFLEDSPYLLLATNTGSLFYICDIINGLLIFASERFILMKLLKHIKSLALVSNPIIVQIKPSEALNIDLSNFKLNSFKFQTISKNTYINSPNSSLKFVLDYTRNPKTINRCTKCVLPITYPFMDLDSEGVCRYCRRHSKFSVRGEDQLFKEVEKYRSLDGNPDCIVAVSGGRDSCYGLHYIKKVLGMNPIAFTYDWGLVTDLARRNTARVCGSLGIEHIYRTPNLSMKRKNVRLNVEAWLKKPELGMIPLFLAGDKAFYYHARKLRKETGIKLVFFCTGNMMEDTPYKFGYSGVKGGECGNRLTKLSSKDKIGLIYYYFKHFILNPSYINKSLLDTALAYWHTFVINDDFLYLFQYLHWDENTVVKTIIDNYEWETSPDTNTTWRIGDATAAFYNYIYYTIAGFSEDDDMLSHMVREGILSREEAIIKSEDYSKPRVKSIIEYCQMVGINYEETISTINRAKRIY